MTTFQEMLNRIEELGLAKFEYSEDDCPGHIASSDPKVCPRCGCHIDSLRPDDGGKD